MGLVRDSFLRTVIHNSGILTCILLQDSEGRFGHFHAMQEGADYKVITDDKTQAPVPVYVCICEASCRNECICGAYNYYREWVTPEGEVVYEYIPPDYSNLNGYNLKDSGDEYTESWEGC